MVSTVPANGHLETKKSSLLEYLKYAPLHAYYYLNSSGTITFHWADWRETCLFQNSYLYQNPFARKKLGDLQNKVNEFKEKIVYLKNSQEEQREVTLYDLYALYFHEKDFRAWVEKEDIKCYSFTPRYEECRELLSMQWFDRNDYRNKKGEF